MQRLTSLSVWLLCTAPLYAQLNEDCNLRVNAQTANANADGSYQVNNVAASTTLVRIDAVCEEDGITLYGGSTFFEVVTGQRVTIENVPLSPTPLATVVSIQAAADTPTLTGIGQTTQISVTALDSTGAEIDVTARADGSTYVSTNPSIASVDEEGVVTAVASGRAFISILNQGAITVISVNVALGDPFTSIEGYVVDGMGQPVGGADISVFGVMVATSDAVTGFFTADDVPTVLGDVAAVATINIDGTQFGGKSVPVRPVPEGVTDLGIIALEDDTARWVCDDGTWSLTPCWIALQGADPYPDNGAFDYNALLPDRGLAYTVTTDVAALQLLSLGIADGATLSLGSTDFMPGSINNAGTLEVANDDLLMTADVLNDGVIRFDTDTGSEDIDVQFDLTLGGGGVLAFPDTGSSTTSTHQIEIQSTRTLTQAAGHTIAGGPGQIASAFTTGTFVNAGTVLADVAGRMLELTDNTSGNFMQVVNSGLMRAENGGALWLNDIAALTSTGTVGCDASSTVRFLGGGTMTLGGVVACDGVCENSGASVVFNEASGSGTGVYRQTSGPTTFGNNTTVAFGTVDITAGNLTVSNGGLVTVRDSYTHALTTETSHNFNSLGGLRVTGGATAGPMDFDDFANIEIAGADLGSDAANHVGVAEGFLNNFHLPQLILAPGAKVNLFDVINNGNRGGVGGVAEALYVDILVFEDAAGVLNLNAHHLYYNTLIGDPSQIVDSGGNSGKGVVSNWTCTTDSWSQSTCWDNLAAGDDYPDNDNVTAYEVFLPANAGMVYVVTMDAAAVELRSLSVDADAEVLLNSSDFRPGALTSAGVVEVASDDLLLTDDVLNDGIIRFDTDTGSEDIDVQFDLTLGGSGMVEFPDTGSSTTSTHQIEIQSTRTLTQAAGHTIAGGPGQIASAFTTGTFVNAGTVLADVAGRTLELTDNTSGNFMQVVNSGLMRAENGGALWLNDIAALTSTGTVGCDASSTVRFLGGGTMTLGGVVACDGVCENSGASVVFNEASGSGTGVYRQTSGPTTFGSNTTVEFGAMNIEAGNITVANGGLVTVRDSYTHALSVESSHDFNAIGALRVTGGTAAGPTAFDDFASIEIAGEDLGIDAANYIGDPLGFVDNFSLPRLIVAAGAKVNLFDVVNNGNRGGVGGNDEALYVDVLEFEDGAGVLNLNDHHLYYNTLIGNPAQIVDSGGNSGKGVVSNWTCTTDNWSQNTCWDNLAPGASYPDNNDLTAYDAFLPANGGMVYVVTMDAAAVELRSLSVDADAEVLLNSSDFRPGALTSAGVVEVASDDLLLTDDVLNDGIIRFDTDTGSEDIDVQFDLTLGGSGMVEFPDTGSSTTSTHQIEIQSTRTLTQAAGHTIAGGPGQIASAFTTGTFINAGTVLADVAGRTLELTDNTSGNFMQVVNSGLMRAENGGALWLNDIAALTSTGTVGCDASSTVRFLGGGTMTLDGLVTCDGVCENSGASVVFNEASGSGTGVYRQTSGPTTFGSNTTVEFGTVNIEAGNITVANGGLVTVRDNYTHALTVETSHNFNAIGGLRVTGGTAAGPTDFADFADVEIGGEDLGTDAVNHVGDPAGFVDNFALPRLIVAPGAKANLIDAINNGNRNGIGGDAEALYVETLVFEDGAGLLNLNGLHLYYNALVGSPAQIVDTDVSIIFSTWSCMADSWSQTGCWDSLSGGDSFPDNSVGTSYAVILPEQGGASYTVTVDGAAGDIELVSLDVSIDTLVLLNSSDFRPGALTSAGVVEVASDDLLLTDDVLNDGIIRFDTDTGSEDIDVQFDLTLDGIGMVEFPDTGSSTTSTHQIEIQSTRTLTQAAGHTIAGGPGQIASAFTTGTFINAGTVLADVAGRTLELTDNTSGNFMQVVNSGLMRAENGGALWLNDIAALTSTGTVGCDASSTVRFLGGGTMTLDGLVTCDGVCENSGASVVFNEASGSGTGVYRQTSGPTTFGSNTTVEFGAMNIEAGNITVANGGLVTVRDSYTHALSVETSHNFNAIGALRVTGGTAAGPTAFDDFASIEIAGEDLGTDAANYIGDPLGFVDNFSLPRLIVAPGAKVNLFDVINNGNRGGVGGNAEALYVDVLEFEDGAGVLNLNDHHLYYNTLIGNPAQIVDSGGNSGKGVVSNWTCTTDNWSQNTCWDNLAPGASYPDNNDLTAYDAFLPANGGMVYVVTMDAAAVELRSLSVDADAEVLLNSSDFRPGALTSAGVVEVASDDLLLTDDVLNDGIIRFDTDTGSEDIDVQFDLTLDGIGMLEFPDTGSSTTSTHQIEIQSTRTLTQAAGHTIAGGPGQIASAFTTGTFVNAGTVLADVAGRTLELTDNTSGNFMQVVNSGLMRAENGGALWLNDIAALTSTGTVGCDASSTVRFLGGGTMTLGGVVACDGVCENSSASVTFNGAAGSGGGIYRQTAGVTTFGDNTTAEFGTVNIEAGSITVINGGLVTVRDNYTFALTVESSHDFNAIGGLRVTGGTTAGPTDFNDFSNVEIGGEDLGTDAVNHVGAPAGFVANFALPRLIVAPGAKVNLVDAINNGNRNGVGGAAEALYVDVLEFGDAAGVLNLNGLHLYYNALIGNPSQIVDSGG